MQSLTSTEAKVVEVSISTRAAANASTELCNPGCSAGEDEAALELRNRSRGHCSGDDDRWNLLPTDILAHVFSFLEYKHRIRCEATCRTWREVNGTVDIFTPIHIDDKTMKESSFRSFLSRQGRKIRSLSFIGRQVDADEAAALFESCAKVHSFVFKMPDFDSVRYGQLFRRWPDLRRLTISQSTVKNGARYKSSGYRCLELPAECAENLRYLKLEEVGCSSLRLHYPRLEELDVQCSNVRDADIQSLLRVSGNMLTNLSLSDCRLSSISVTDALECCTGLTAVTFRHDLACDLTLEVVTRSSHRTLRKLSFHSGRVSLKCLKYLERCAELCDVYISNFRRWANCPRSAFFTYHLPHGAHREQSPETNRFLHLAPFLTSKQLYVLTMLAFEYNDRNKRIMFYDIFECIIDNVRSSDDYGLFWPNCLSRERPPSHVYSETCIDDIDTGNDAYDTDCEEEFP